MAFSNDYGANWDPSTIGFQPWTSVAVSASGQYQIAGQSAGYAANSGLIYYSSNYGQTWTVVTSSPSNSWGTVATRTEKVYNLVMGERKLGLVHRLSAYITCGTFGGLLTAIYVLIDYVLAAIFDCFIPRSSIEYSPDCRNICFEM